MNKLGEDNYLIKFDTQEQWDKINGLSKLMFGSVFTIYRDLHEVMRINKDGQNGLGTVEQYQGLYGGHRWLHAIDIIEAHEENGSRLRSEETPPSEKENGNNTKMEKFYRLKQASATHDENAVFMSTDGGSYKPVDDIFARETDNKELESAINSVSIAPAIVENSPKWYERVYKRSSIKGAIFVTKKILKDLTAKMHISADEGEDEDK